MRALALLVAALLGTFLVVGVGHAAAAGSPAAAGHYLQVEVKTLPHPHLDLGFADEVTPAAPAVALQRNHVRSAVAVPVTPTATRVDSRVARGPPTGR
ncbi:hypothetical protein ABZ816_03460 [Actinosynnema sp. NPDC047251]|uniref:Putative secreted protein n=1 Tax=Saccharothrix espanaensis (strain ATCC 51144 / DSM 44229 / JCM 9112 / NBRC 15066 / NRRL 15764) TaxID=1179773 RepID=K0JU21_SACES|nr:hypothetical protein [Saccharothrix espanaensis]CCH31315.1 putative secreted protein [Saccharothrix espanaensis DSM 44229]